MPDAALKESASIVNGAASTTNGAASFAKATEGNLRSASGQRKRIARTTHKSGQVLVERTYTSTLTFKSDYAPIYS